MLIEEIGRRATWESFSFLIRMDSLDEIAQEGDLHHPLLFDQIDISEISRLLHELTHLWSALVSHFGDRLCREAEPLLEEFLARDDAMTAPLAPPASLAHLIAGAAPFLEGLALFCELDYLPQIGVVGVPLRTPMYGYLEYLTGISGVELPVYAKTAWTTRISTEPVLRLLLLDQNRKTAHYFAGYLIIKALYLVARIREPRLADPGLFLKLIVRLVLSTPFLRDGMLRSSRDIAHQIFTEARSALDSKHLSALVDHITSTPGLLPIDHFAFLSDGRTVPDPRFVDPVSGTDSAMASWLHLFIPSFWTGRTLEARCDAGRIIIQRHDASELDLPRWSNLHALRFAGFARFLSTLEEAAAAQWHMQPEVCIASFYNIITESPGIAWWRDRKLDGWFPMQLPDTRDFLASDGLLMPPSIRQKFQRSIAVPQDWSEMLSAASLAILEAVFGGAAAQLFENRFSGITPDAGWCSPHLLKAKVIPPDTLLTFLRKICPVELGHAARELLPYG